MKIVLHNGSEIFQVIENAEQIEIDREKGNVKSTQCVILGTPHQITVLNDDEPAENALSLERYKAEKIAELNNACEATILAGFYCEATGHVYEFSAYDQMNFTQQYLILTSNLELTAPILWKTEDAGVVEHTREEFIAVCETAEKHKRGNIEKYWQLKAQVENAATFEEVNAVQWEPFKL